MTSPKQGILPKIAESRVGLCLYLIGVGLFSLLYPKWIRDWINRQHQKGQAFDDVIGQLAESKYSLDVGGVSSESVSTKVLSEKIRWLLSDLETKDTDINDLEEQRDELKEEEEELHTVISTLTLEKVKLISHLTSFYSSSLFNSAKPHEDEKWNLYLDTESAGILRFDIDRDHLDYFPLSVHTNKDMWVGIPELNIYDTLEQITLDSIPPHVGKMGTILSYDYDENPCEPTDILHIDMENSHRNTEDGNPPYHHLWLVQDIGGSLYHLTYKFDRYEELDEFEELERGYICYTDPVEEKEETTLAVVKPIGGKNGSDL